MSDHPHPDHDDHPSADHPHADHGGHAYAERRLDEAEVLAGQGPRTWRGRPVDRHRVGQRSPARIAATLRFCSRCGTAMVERVPPGEQRARMECPDCSFIAYVNPRLVVTTLPVTDAGEVLLLRRGIEPARGLWAQPGGFLEIDETVREAAVRETLEEIGVVVQPGEIVGLYSRPEAAIVVVAFEARILGGEPHPTPEALEVRAFTPEAIPWPEIAFKTTWFALQDWLALHHPEVPPPEGFGHVELV